MYNFGESQPLMRPDETRRDGTLVDRPLRMLQTRVQI